MSVNVNISSNVCVLYECVCSRCQCKHSVTAACKKQQCVLWAVELPVGSVLVSVELVVQTVPTIRAFSLQALWQETSSSSSVSSHTHTEFRIPFLSCKMSNCSLSRSRAPLFQPGCLISGHFHSSAAQISNTPTTLSIFMWLHRPKSVHSQGRIWSSYLRFVPSSPQPHVSLLKITKHPSCLETDLCVFSSLMASSGKTHSLFLKDWQLNLTS